MIDYDREAARYDVTRGGDAQASAAADAIESLLPRPRSGSLNSALARGSSLCVCSGPAEAGQLTPDRLWAEAERRISGPED
jgi:hypothetical protein